MSQGSLFDDDAKAARDAALKRVKDNGGGWQGIAGAGLALIDGFVGTAEDIRIRLIMKGVPDPHHHNAWGAFIKDAITDKRLVPTGETRHMKTTKSHARRTPVYVVRP